jgi:DNA-binding beta-propeller fold protein YncE
MPRSLRLTLVALAALFGSAVWTWHPQAQAPATPPTPQSTVAPSNDAPNPYETVEGYFKMPEGRKWGSTSAVDIDRDGKSIWVAERCGANNCWVEGKMSPLDPVLKFDASGKLVRSFGAGMIVWPHGIHVDRDGNVWVTDARSNLPGGGRRGGAAEAAPPPPPPATVIGNQVFKFSPEGKLLLTLGKPGGNRPGETPDQSSFWEPNDVITNAAGEIFVAEGHNNNSPYQRISKFDRNGKFLKDWGKPGSGPGEFRQPHGLAFDSKGRLFVADRGNDRIQIFDQDGKLLEHGWEQYSRISGLWIDPKDMLYAADSESGSVAPARKDWKRGIRIGSVRDGKDGKIQFFIPDPSTATSGTLAAEGVAVDAAGNVYGAEVGPAQLKKYVRK